METTEAVIKIFDEVLISDEDEKVDSEDYEDKNVGDALTVDARQDVDAENTGGEREAAASSPQTPPLALPIPVPRRISEILQAGSAPAPLLEMGGRLARPSSHPGPGVDTPHDKIISVDTNLATAGAGANVTDNRRPDGADSGDSAAAEVAVAAPPTGTPGSQVVPGSGGLEVGDTEISNEEKNTVGEVESDEEMREDAELAREDERDEEPIGGLRITRIADLLPAPSPPAAPRPLTYTTVQQLRLLLAGPTHHTDQVVGEEAKDRLEDDDDKAGCLLRRHCDTAPSPPPANPSGENSVCRDNVIDENLNLAAGRTHRKNTESDAAMNGNAGEINDAANNNYDGASNPHDEDNMRNVLPDLPGNVKEVEIVSSVGADVEEEPLDNDPVSDATENDNGRGAGTGLPENSGETSVVGEEENQDSELSADKLSDGIGESIREHSNLTSLIG